MASAPTEGTKESSTRLRLSYVLWLAIPALYFLLACLAFYPVPPLAEHRLLTCACADSIDQTWFLAWTGHALSVGSNPFFTTAMNYPAGINVLSNVSMVALGILFAPISLTIGPVAAFNLAMRLGLALSGTSLFLVLRWWRISWLPAALAGLAYAFSPFMIGQATGHLHMAFAPIPPIIFFCLERGLSGRWPARGAGLWLGALAVVEFFIAIEIVTSLIVMCMVIVAVAWALDWHGLRHRARRIGALVGWAAVLAVPLLIAPVLFIVKGPGSFSGTAQPVAVLSQYRADLLSVVVPTDLQRFGLASWKALGSSFAAGNGSENGEYLGATMVIALVVITAVLWKRKVVIVAAAALVAAFLLTLGPSLIVDGRPTGVRLPFDVIAHVPFFQNQIPLRYSLYLQMFAAGLGAYGFDYAWRRLRRGRAGGGGVRQVAGRVGLVVAAAAVLLPLVPALPYTSQATNVPAFFTTREVDQLKPGTVVLAYPFPAFPNDAAMLWQAESGWRFRLIGGYAYRRNDAGKASLVPKTLAPVVVQEIWYWADGGLGAKGLPPNVTLKDAAVALRAFCFQHHVGALLLGSGGSFPGTVRKVAELAFPGRARVYPGLEVIQIPS